MRNGRLWREKRIEVYLGLGSNLGDRKANLQTAVAQIRGLVLDITRESSIYETEPVGFSDQRWFLNQVIAAEIPAIQFSGHEADVDDDTEPGERPADAFLSDLLNIELAMGRERKIENGPRIIDIDLLLFGDEIIGYSRGKPAEPLKKDRIRDVASSDLCVPHPRMHARRFV